MILVINLNKKKYENLQKKNCLTVFYNSTSCTSSISPQCMRISSSVAALKVAFEGGALLVAHLLAVLDVPFFSAHNMVAVLDHGKVALAIDFSDYYSRLTQQTP